MKNFTSLFSTNNKLDHILKKIWNNKDFMNGKRYFWFANYNYFHILDKDEYQKLNLDVDEEKFSNKKIIAVSDWNGDKEHTAYLYIDTKTLQIYIYQIYTKHNPKRILISTPKEFGNIFCSIKILDLLTKEDNNQFIEWYEGVLKLPIEGVFPTYDLREYFKNLPKTFFSKDSGFNINTFRDYFSIYNLTKYIDDDFHTRGYYNELNELLSLINSENEKTEFKKIIFNPSSDWGIVNIKELDDTVLNDLIELGLLKK